MKSFFRLFPAVPFALAAAGLFSTSCATDKPESESSGWTGQIVPPGPRAVYGRVLLAGAKPNDANFATDDEGGLANVFVHVSRGLEGRVFEAPAKPVVIEGAKQKFDPAVIGAQVGQKVIWKTADKGGYNLASRPAVARNPVFKYLLMPNVSVETSYPAPEQFLRHETDTIPGMNAYVCVVEHTYFGVTDDKGVFHLPGQLPPGRYTLTARHATAGSVSAELTIQSGYNARIELAIGAPGSGQASRLTALNMEPAIVDERGKRIADPRRNRTARSAAVAAKKIDLQKPSTTATARPAPRKLILSQTVIGAKPAPEPRPTSQTLQRPTRTPTVKPSGDLKRDALPSKAGAADQTVTRVFKVDAERLLKGLKDSYSGNADKASLHSLIGYSLGKGLRPEAGGEFMPNVALNADGGALLVRANEADMERIQSLVDVLNLAPAQVSLDARIMEVAVKDFDRYIESHPVYSQTLNTENFNGILTEAEFRDMLQRLSEMKGARLVYAPSVTTLSGHLAEFQFDPETTLSIEPTAGPDGEDVRMDVLFALFPPGEARSENGKPNQSLKTTTRVQNRQTIMLGGLIKAEGKGRSRLSSRGKNVIMLLITPTVVKAPGNSSTGR